MDQLQWTVTAGTAIFVALVAFFQWRTAQNKAVLDLFGQRHEIYEAIRTAVAKIVSNSQTFGSQDEHAFLVAKHRAYFFFGSDVDQYLEQLWRAIVDVTSADSELRATTNQQERAKILDRRRRGFEQVESFYKIGQPMFARYMRFSQKMPWSPSRR
jgi:hypothetical protein